MTTCHSINQVLTRSFIAFILLTTPSLNEVIEFGFETKSKCSQPATVTLWFDYEMYQWIVTPSESDTWYMTYKYSFPTFTELGPYECPNSNDTGSSQAKLMIESNSGDGLGIRTVNLTTDTDWFGIDRFMINGNDVDFACISSAEADCDNQGTGGIYKQMFYFDLTKPNEFITAQWSNAMDIYPETEIKTCNPTKSPTSNPTSSPTSHPTSPIINPTINPTKNPTDDPTEDPTAFPSKMPSTFPSVIPTIIPPTFSPSNIATLSLTNDVSDVTKTISTFLQGDEEEHEINDYRWLYAVFIMGTAVALCFCCVVVYKKNKSNLIVENAQSNDVSEWIQNNLKMSQYVDNFISNGYDSMDAILTIASVSQLIEIGIIDKEHQSYIIGEINELQSKVEPKCNDNPPFGLIKIASLSTKAATQINVKVDDSDDDMIEEINQMDINNTNTVGEKDDDDVNHDSRAEGDNDKVTVYNMNASADEIVIGNDEATLGGNANTIGGDISDELIIT